MTDWTSIRAQYPGLTGRTFLDAACVSLMPQRAHEAVTAFSARLVDPAEADATAHHIWMDAQREQAVHASARLLECAPRHVALVESTTHGLNIAAQAIPWRAGDEVLMCDLEFLQVAIPFVQLAQRAGVRPVFVRHRDGIADVDAFRAAATPATRAIVVSSTQWSNGYRIDLDGLAQLAREHGAWLVIDAIQQAGALPVSLHGVDFLIAGGHKWLNAPMGTGFMYMSGRALEELEPAAWGYLALEPPDGGWGTYFSTPSITPDRSYGFVAGAKRFEIGGTGNYPGAIALAQSLDLVNEVGIARAATRVWALGERLQEGLRALPVRLETPFAREHRAGIVSFTLGERGRDLACLEHLTAARIYVAHRYTSGTGGVRVSVHYFNDENDIDHVLAETAAFLRR